ncbi:acyl carrier protein [Chitinophaga solisilvae]|uniref:acyl carrier protein n=1 Tax=Chitinophaga solisilvae TaxID=1233460 RepID=UPI001367E8CB|nr:acyl carrier protein [Chitinophaga solisilvae]
MRNTIVDLITRTLVEIIPDLSAENIDPDETFVDLGANSVDRGELIALTLERLDLDIPRTDLAGAQTINELADLLTARNS